MKENPKSDMANAEPWLIPALAKKKIVIASLRPKPPKDMGSREMALIIGMNTKK